MLWNKYFEVDFRIRFHIGQSLEQLHMFHIPGQAWNLLFKAIIWTLGPSGKVVYEYFCPWSPDLISWRKCFQLFHQFCMITVPTTGKIRPSLIWTIYWFLFEIFRIHICITESYANSGIVFVLSGLHGRLVKWEKFMKPWPELFTYFIFHNQIPSFTIWLETAYFQPIFFRCLTLCFSIIVISGCEHNPSHSGLK